MKFGSLAARLSRSAAAGALVSVIGVPALAQQTPAPGQAVETTQPAEPATESDGSERVVVTGSRLANQFASSSSMDIITAEEATVQGITDVASLLRSTTVAAGSPQITAITSTAFVQNGGIGSESISLRGLGANRTLVLLDGRRAGPAGTRGAVGAFDLNVIPLSAIERVDILKEGASSIYGSDAVAGVVNIITKKGDGADMEVFGSMPVHGGGEQFRINGSWGETFNNLHVRVTGDYFKQQALRRGDRDFFSCSNPYVFRADGTRADLVDPRTGKYVCSGDLPWGQIWYYDYQEPGAITRPWQARPQFIQYNYGNVLQNYLPGFGPTTNPATFGANWFPVGYGELNRPGAIPDPFYQPSAAISEALIDYKHPFQDLVSLSPEVERMTVFGQGEYDVNDSMQLYGEVLLNRRMTKSYGYRQFWTYQYVYDYGGGDFVGDPLAIEAGFTGGFIGLSPLSITDHANDTISVDYMRFVAGARGDLPFLTDWTWDTSVQFSRSDGTYKSDIVWDDAITAEEFRNDRCAGELTVYRQAPCVDIPWYDPNFLNGVFTPAQEAFLFGTSIGNTVYEQLSFEGYVTGDLFSLPAGPVGVVFGALYQEDSIKDVPDKVVQDGQAWGSSSAQITEGEDTTTAVYTEIGVPILRDVPAFKELTLTASGRYNDVDSYGSESTYKVGLNWALTDSFRFRASQGTSFRSPALFELFLQSQTAFVGQRVIDPCINWGANLANGGISQRIADNCAADGIPNNHNGSGDDAMTITSGGFGSLAAETSTSKSVGLIWTPSFMDFQLSVDYFDIEVENEVTLLGATNIMLGCYDSLNFATEPLCDLFFRSPAGSATQFLVEEVTDNYLNIATQQNRGIDIDAVYKQSFDFGDLTLHGQAAYQLEDEQQLLPSSEPLEQNGLIGNPEWVGNFDATLETGPFEFFWGIRYVGETSNAERFGTQPQTYQLQPVRYVLGTDEFFYHNVSVAVEPEEGLNVRLGISNLLDEKPPFVTELSGEFDSTIGNVPVVSNYDFFGRTVFLNITKSF